MNEHADHSWYLVRSSIVDSCLVQHIHMYMQKTVDVHLGFQSNFTVFLDLPAFLLKGQNLDPVVAVLEARELASSSARRRDVLASDTDFSTCASRVL
jgi:hypothetical protein